MAQHISHALLNDAALHRVVVIEHQRQSRRQRAQFHQQRLDDHIQRRRLGGADQATGGGERTGHSLLDRGGDVRQKPQPMLVMLVERQPGRRERLLLFRSQPLHRQRGLPEAGGRYDQQQACVLRGYKARDEVLASDPAFEGLRRGKLGWHKQAQRGNSHRSNPFGGGSCRHIIGLLGASP
jgi:hypothetical protein